ncbi:SDR family oxidoreductase [Bacillus atrophaeus]|uniref:Epimerase n=1 Tax=Bacillus atrophaeus (strain 1942) TaxID=720555 RepID=A0ABM5LUL8_BACA1|nr:SDR family oxidoreductase [Bacillus atrophaeus]AMR63530.1 sugar epimerase [Bacillus subtilis subsp. globigii]ADP31504.1 putative epimerase [Bacillus atrophaeus 1942]AIK49193.1 3-beta hydroxysteroid dehydrogenase/isomerase family protein [Bacillus atrophaeus subsp. globigii]EIM10223.1 putative epimerase [Bacillus atrophaeus C89]KFK82797.1 3-beta hydroxysteroid dehydrogenase/isomerase family protein [Bacillus atrophaeus]
MKVFLIGANGQIGQRLVGQFQQNGAHTVRAMVRKPEQKEALQASGTEAVIANLEGSPEEIAAAAKGCDAIVFTAGSGGSTGHDKTLLIDLDGAAKAIEAAEIAGIKRFIMISALQAHNRENWNESLKPYYAAKHYADKILEASGLTYTIIRPGGLLNETGTGLVSAAADVERGSISRDDVAAAVIASLDESNTENQAFDLTAGETPIAEALKNL